MRGLGASPLYPVAAFLLGERVRVRGWSMHPVLAPDEWVLFDRLAYCLTGPSRGDIALARDPRDGRYLIKRVAGVPGDRLDGRLLGADEYFLLGEAQDLSTDSRDFGPVGRRQLLGRGWLVYWPPDRFRVLRAARAVVR